MPTLMIEHGNTRRAGKVRGRVLIGRSPLNTVVVEDASISRLHAWIARDGQQYYIADSSSRTGTYVNGQRVQLRQPLRDGDEIQIGPLRLWLSSGSTVPPDAQPIDLSPRTLAGRQVQGGVFQECRCGAPIWIPANYAAKTSQCRYCGRRLGADESQVEESVPPAVAEPPKEVAMCSICQSSISNDEQTQTCPECGLIFHEECWTENRGCAAFGCSQVGALEKKIDIEAP
jgi:pSer/pThr/pTyr-binding forkhead associated (FHA) protein